jgi:allophanate hydrolase subunit 2
VLLPDHATVGGYPVLATVITADHPVLGRLRPGDRVRLRLVGPEDARAASVEHARRRDAAVAGWYPTGSGT